MPFYQNRCIYTHNTQSRYSHPPLVIRQKEPAFSTGSETSESTESASNRPIDRKYDKDLIREVEDFVESIRKEVIQREARRVSATTPRERLPLPLYTHPNSRMAPADADAGNSLAILQPRKAFRNSTLCHKINTCGGRRQLLRSTGVAHRLGDREIARVIEEVTKSAKQLTVRVVDQYDIERAVRRMYAWKRREGGPRFRRWNNF